MMWTGGKPQRMILRSGPGKSQPASYTGEVEEFSGPLSSTGRQVVKQGVRTALIKNPSLSEAVSGIVSEAAAFAQPDSPAVGIPLLSGSATGQPGDGSTARHNHS